MHLYLGRHSAIFMPDIKEINFFGADLEFKLSYSVSSTEYLEFFRAANREQIIGETSVLYLYSQTAAREIHEFNPDAKILIMLRDPVETMYSHHNQLISTADEDILDFGAALDAEESRRNEQGIPRLNLISDYLYYRKIVCFSEQVRRYFDVFGRARVHVIIFDDFLGDTAASYRETLQFLDVDTDFAPTLEQVNASKKVRWKGLRDFIKRPPRIIREPVRKLTTISARRRLRALADKFNTNDSARALMDSDLRLRLKEEFRPEVERLGHLLGRDLSHWSQLD